MEKIYKKDINKVMPILQAFAEGKTIQFAVNGDSWIDIDSNEKGLFLDTLMATPQRYRIKPKFTYRPFKDTEECLEEMQKHQPFGWIKNCGSWYNIISTGVASVKIINTQGAIDTLLFSTLLSQYKFVDGALLGVKEEEQLWHGQ